MLTSEWSASMADHDSDMKKNISVVNTVNSTHSIETEETNKVWAFITLISKKLDGLGVETRGIERIMPYERATNKTKQLITVIGLWCSACGGLSSMSSFYLAPLVFGLGLRNTLISGILGETLGCVIAAYCAMMGPRSGCRQMVSARFLFGCWFVKIVALVSIIGGLGWSVVNSVVGGQIISSLTNGSVTLSVGIVIIAVVSFLVATFGIKHLLRVEAYLSIPVNFAFLMLFVCSSKKYQYLTLEDSPDLDSATIKGNWICFFSLAYSITATWGSIASDYLILFPENTPSYQIFWLTCLGIWLPTTFVGMAGILIGNVALTYEPWNEVYEQYGMGGLLNESFKPWHGGGKFLLVLIYLSLISNNIINTYSAAFSFQLIGDRFHSIPRWLWAICITAIYLVCALVGRNKFSEILGNFLPMIGYWISMYFIILLEENQIFRTKWFLHLYTKEFEDVSETTSISSQSIAEQPMKSVHKYYNFNIWNDYLRLTQGYAASIAFIVGATGAAVGMSQTYWVGPIARLIGGDNGGDIAMWLCMGFSGLVFPGLRYLELKKFGR